MTAAFVTGGSGFLGRALVAELVRRGVSVRALARSEAAAATVRAAGAEAVMGDLHAAEALAAGMRGADWVFHSAAKVTDWGPKKEFQKDTIDGTKAVLAAAKAAGVMRFVHVSTEAVLVGEGGPIHAADETRPLPRKPLGLYPWSKGRAEDEVRAAAAAGLGAVIVRPRFIWGKGDTVLLPRLVDAVKKKQWAWIGGGRYKTSTAHVRNVVHGLILAAEKGRAGETYFVTDGEPVEFREFIGAMLRTQGVDPGDKALPRWIAGMAAWLGEAAWTLAPLGGQPPLTRSGLRLIGEEVTVSDAKARQELGYAPVVSVEAGLAELSAP